MERLPGLSAAKDQMQTMVNRAIVADRRRAAGQKVAPRNNHLVLAGSPGTGKTMMMDKMAELMFELGQVSNPEPVYAKRDEIGGKYVNQAAGKAKEFFAKNRGRVIVIDEAYKLHKGPNDETGDHIMDELLVAADEYRDDTIFVLAGYDQEMDDLLSVNQGLVSRFPNRIHMPDYTSEEKGEVLQYMVDDQGLRFADRKAQRAAMAYAGELPSSGQAGNARAVRNFLDVVRQAQDNRLAEADSFDDDALQVLTIDDLRAAAASKGLKPLASKVSSPAKRHNAEQAARRVGRKRALVETA